MIGFIEGAVRLIRAETLVVDVRGIGMEVFVSNPSSYTQNQNVFLYTYMHIREDVLMLFGFEKEEAYEIFCRLIQVKGIGPKTALKILGSISAADMLAAIEQSDLAALKKLPGIGAKSASQIILDLKGKIVLSKQASFRPDETPQWREAKEALAALGWKAADLAFLDPDFAVSTEDASVLLRKALQVLAKRKGV